MSEAPAADAGGADSERTTTRRLFALLSALLLAAFGLVTGGVVGGLGGALASVVTGGSLAATFLVLLLGSQIGIAGVALAYVAARPRLADVVERVLGGPVRAHLELGVRLPSGRDALVALGGWLAAVVGVLIVLPLLGYVLSQVVDEEPGANPTADVGLEQPEVLLLLIPFMLLVVGPAEELLFRGVVQGRLREAFSGWTAIVLASVVFAGLHFLVLVGGGPTANAIAVSILLVPAVVFGAAYEYTDNLVVPALIHGLYNSTWLLLLYALLAYTDAFEQAGEAAVLALG